MTDTPTHLLNCDSETGCDPDCEMSPPPDNATEGGDFVTIGPECFAYTDGSLLCWKGRNYVPQSGPAFEAGAVELVSMDPPLLEAAKDRLTQEVVIHILGGMQLEGTLESVNDDLTITVRDRRRRYDVALASVAVVEGDR